MTEEIRLYDIREKNYPNRRDDSFRSLQVFECTVCEVLTNEVIMGGAPGLGVKMICPYSAECWHHELQIKIQDLRLKFKSEPQKFREIVVTILGTLRRFEILTDDIIGNADVTLKSSVSNSFSKRVDKRCLHESGTHGIFRILDYLYGG